MFCTTCGGEIPAGGRFCGGCGSAVTTASAPPSRPAAPPPPPIASAPPRGVPPSAPPPPPAPPAYYPPQGGFAPPASYPPQAMPGYPPQAAYMPAPGGPVPPDMHWAVILILSGCTGGLAAVIWMFKQAAFVKKLDPGSKAMALSVIWLLAMLCQVGFFFVPITSFTEAEIAAAAGVILILILNLVIAVMGLIAIFGMRSSIVEYYNTVEPIGLRLSGVMTFFFSILYLQYHFSRIADLKRTGRLP